MLGERRSKVAFSAGFAERVQEQPHENSGHLPAEIWKEEDPDFEEIMEDRNETEENRQRDFFGGEDGAVEKTEEPEEEESEPSHVQKTGGRSLRTHDLFFAAEDTSRDFTSVLREVQAYLSKEYSSLVTADGNEEVKAQIRRFAGKYIQDHRIQVTGKTTDELIDAIYSEFSYKVHLRGRHRGNRCECLG